MFSRLTPMRKTPCPPRPAKSAGPLLAALLLAGCSTLPLTTALPPAKEVTDEVARDWADIPAITNSNAKTGVTLESPADVPEKIRNIPVDLTLDPGATLNDLAMMLGHIGVPVLINNEESSARKVYIPRYQGTVGSLLNGLAAANGISYEWRRGVVVFSEASRYLITLPQDEVLMEKLTEDLTAMGALEVQASLGAGMVTYTAAESTQAVIAPYLERLSKNAALVTLQVAIVTVGYDQQRDTGFDWSRLQATFGDLALLSSGSAIPTLVSDGQTADGTDSVTAPTPTAPTYGAAATLSGAEAGLKITKRKFTLDTFVRFLSTYGNTNTKQNVSLKTLAGTEVKLKSGQKIPYVSEKRSSTTVTNRTDTIVNTDVITNAETGINLTLKPLYDAESQLVTVNVDLTMTNLLGFISFDDGIQSPNTQDQSFNNVVRLPAGAVAIIGGIVYDSVTDNRTSVAGLESRQVGSKTAKVTRNIMFIVLRPTVNVYGTFPDKAGAQP